MSPINDCNIYFQQLPLSFHRILCIRIIQNSKLSALHFRYYAGILTMVSFLQRVFFFKFTLRKSHEKAISNGIYQITWPNSLALKIRTLFYILDSSTFNSMPWDFIVALLPVVIQFNRQCTILWSSMISIQEKKFCWVVQCLFNPAVNKEGLSLSKIMGIL